MKFIRLAGSATVFAVVLLSTGCGLQGQTAPLGSGCFPPPFVLGAATAKTGGTITVKAGPATCQSRYGATARIQLALADASGQEVLSSRAPMSDQGAFSAELRIPASMASGAASVTAVPYNLDWCDDTGRNNRLGAAAGPELQLESCMIPTQPLLIEP